MPKYNQNVVTGSPCPALAPGIPGGQALWSADTQAATTANPTSQQANIPKMPWTRGTIRCAVEISFSADPGNFVIQMQDANTDQDKFYNPVLLNGAPVQFTEANLNTLFTCRAEFDIAADFIRAKMVTAMTNAVTVTLTVHQL